MSAEFEKPKPDIAPIGKRFLDRILVTPPELRALAKAPIFRLWIAKSWAAFIAAILYGIFAHWIFPAMMRPALRLIFPPTKGTGLDRISTFLNNSRVEDARVDRALSFMSPVVWLFGSALVLALFELAIKPAIAAARSRSRTLEHEADAKISRSPSESILLYRRALDFAVDARRVEDLKRRLGDVDERLTSGPKPKASDGSWKPASVAVPAVAETIKPDGGVSRRIGTRGRYRLDSELARGGMGVVWKAFDTVLERDIAVKELPPTRDPSLRDRFRQEAQVLARLGHANVVQVFDLVEDDDERLYIAMELVDGGTLEEQLGAGKVPLPKAVELARQVALGLAAAHKRGIIHRDVKPLNVLVTSDGTAKVTDFGLAKLAESTMNTVEGAVMGSPRYMSPEQAAGKPADARSDIYSFGATLFHLLAGKPPFDGDVSALLASHITQPPPAASSINPAIPQGLDQLLVTLLAKDPAARPQNLDTVAETLAAFR